MTRNLLVLGLLVLAVAGVTAVDLVLVREITLPGMVYAIPIVIAAWVLPPGLVVAVTVFAFGVVLYIQLLERPPSLLSMLYLGAVLVVGFLCTALSSRMQRERSLGARARALAEDSRRKAADLEKANRELAHERRFLSSVVDNIPVAITYLDRGLVFRHCNAEAARFLGSPVDKVIGRKLKEIVPDQPDLWEIVDAALTTGQSYRNAALDFRVPGYPADDVVTFTVAVVPDIDFAGEIQGVFAAWQEITELARAQRTLADREERFRLLAEMSSDIIYRFRVKPSPGFEYVSPSATRIIGYTPEEHYQDPELGIKMVHPEDRALFLQVLQDPSQLGRPLTLRWVSKTGNVVWTEQSNTPVFDEFGGLIAFQGVARDITDRKRIEEERERILAELDATIEAMVDGVVIYGPDGSLLRANSAAARTLPYSEREWRLPMEERWRVFPVEDADGRPIPVERLPIRRALRGETVERVVMVMRPKGREPLWLSAGAAPIFGPGHELLAAVATFVDITDLHRLQEQRDDLVRTISHDLRNPLTSILGHAQMLDRALGSDDSANRLQSSARFIAQSAARMASMIQGLVDASRIESGQLPPVREALSLNSVVTELLARSGPALDVSRISVALPDRLPRVLADQGYLERILTNLLSNALKYSPVDARVLLEAAAGDGHVTVSVADAGPGIPEGDLPFLFDRFFRSRQTSGVEGLGLGLYITRMLVEAQGGEMAVSSHVGVGSRFSFTVPTVPDGE